MYDPALKRTDYTHKVVWRRVYGPIPVDPNGKPLEVDERCEVTLCVRPDHLLLLSKDANVRRRGPTRGSGKRASNTTAEVQPRIGNSGNEQFAIALFAGYNQTTVQPRTLSLADLVAMLTTFVEVKDKRQARCWSPTAYSAGMKSRHNDGVEAVSALVFDMDKVPPDPERLAGVCWIARTTWSHRPETPKWRVVFPLAKPVPADRWADVWRRTRGALCPEADPSCKVPSRQYDVPSHAPGLAHEACHHGGPLLDVATLPELPAEQARPELRRSPSAMDPREAMDVDRRRGEAYMEKVIANLEATAPGGRNPALNAAAWTLGRWVAAGALGQGYVEDVLYSAAEVLGLVADDGQRQCWATIRSGLGAGLQQPLDLDR